MTDGETLMWKAERDPVLRSSFLSVTICDGPLDVGRLRRRMRLVVEAVPRLRQRVVERATGHPAWVDDPAFDLEHHVRHAALPGPGSDRQLLDRAAELFEDAFDITRPLWTFLVLDGLSGGRGALLSKLHHTITDGVGGIRMSGMFIDLAPDQEHPTVLPPPTEAPPGRSLGSRLAGLVATPLAGARIAAALARTTVNDPAATARAVGTMAHLDGARSPLWGGRSVRRHAEVLSFDLEALKVTARRHGGTINDLFVSALCEAAGGYHRARGCEVGDLRLSMPVSTRTDKSAGGNAFVPARLLVPCGELEPAARFALVHDRLHRARAETALGLVDAAAGALSRLPPPLVARLARQQTDSVDFAASNVRGAPYDLWIAGAKILHNHPLGPTGGTAFIATVLSTAGTLDLGLCTDRAAIDSPEELRDRIADAFAGLLR